MSFTTRCPACGTKFRVVPDQLRISDGWVRCGRCQEVFDAASVLEPPAAVEPSAPMPALPVEAPSLLTEREEAKALPATQAVAAPTSQDAAEAGWEAVANASVDEAALPASDGARSSAGYELPAPPEAPANGALDWPFAAPAAVADTEPSLASSWWEAAPTANMAGTSDAQPPDAGAQVLPIAPVPPSEDEANTTLAEPTLDALEGRTPFEPALDIELDFDVAPPARRMPLETDGELAPESVTVHASAPLDAMDPVAWAEPAPAPAMDPVQSSLPVSAQQADAMPFEQHDASVTLESPGTVDDGSPDAMPLPSFVKQAQRRAWWNQPAVRFVQGMLLILLPLALLLQVVVHERNTLVAWKPQWRPAFASLCVALRCELAPRKHLASVTLTGSAFVQDGAPQHYRLSLSMRNASVAAVATPAVELTLTDASEQVLVRKVLTPEDLGAPLELGAHGAWSGEVPVATQDLNLAVAGYRVMAFYP